MFKLSSFLAALMNLPLAGHCADGPCQNSAAIERLAATENLYVGETRGTIEAPAFVRCIVESKIQLPGKPLVVSLEMPPDAARPDSHFWSGTDGRSSEAMWDLHSFLLEQQAAGKLSIHYQQSVISHDQREYEQKLAAVLGNIMVRNRLLAYAGNFHSRKTPFAQMPDIVPNGALLGSGVTRVTLEWRQAGTAWFCSGEPTRCEVSSLAERHDAPTGSSEIKEGAEYGHDLAYFFRTFSASRPRATN